MGRREGAWGRGRREGTFLWEWTWIDHSWKGRSPEWSFRAAPFRMEVYWEKEVLSVRELKMEWN